MASSFKEIGNRLKHYMQHRGLTVNKLAHATNIPAKKIAKIIDGKSFSLKKVILIMEVLSDISQVWLLTGGGNMLHKGSAEKKNDSANKNNLPKAAKNKPGNSQELLERLVKNQEKLLKQNKKIINLLEEKKSEPTGHST